MRSPKRIGFLSFGAWHPGGGLTHTGGDALRQTVELAIAAEEIGIDGAFVRVHRAVARPHVTPADGAETVVQLLVPALGRLGEQEAEVVFSD